MLISWEIFARGVGQNPLLKRGSLVVATVDQFSSAEGFSNFESLQRKLNGEVMEIGHQAILIIKDEFKIKEQARNLLELISQIKVLDDDSYKFYLKEEQEQEFNDAEGYLIDVLTSRYTKLDAQQIFKEYKDKIREIYFEKDQHIRHIEDLSEAALPLAIKIKNTTCCALCHKPLTLEESQKGNMDIECRQLADKIDDSFEGILLDQFLAYDKAAAQINDCVVLKIMSGQQHFVQILEIESADELITVLDRQGLKKALVAQKTVSQAMAENTLKINPAHIAGIARIRVNQAPDKPDVKISQMMLKAFMEGRVS